MNISYPSKVKKSLDDLDEKIMDRMKQLSTGGGLTDENIRSYSSLLFNDEIYNALIKQKTEILSTVTSFTIER